MNIFEITVPGMSLDYADRDWCRNVENLLRGLRSEFFKANCALILFDQTTQSERDFQTVKAQWQADRTRVSDLVSSTTQDRTFNYDRDKYQDIYFQAQTIVKREHWAAGELPKEFDYQLPFIYAQTFVYALDSFEKLLGVISKIENIPEEISNLHEEITEVFPHLREVRNSAHHMEDRLRGLGRNNKTMNLKPFDTGPGGIVSLGNGLVLNNLTGSSYGYTMANGSFGDVSITPQSMAVLQDIFTRTLNTFRWTGPKEHCPN
ncbi:hypothetical protein RYA05_25195 [Pseudomonas syringae pv. actinidiae]|uniref:Uncharacterized protein n=2 Tax=Pseudomonas syringae pv. actinidiae TaxID=103796 RepID=A0AAN4TIA4_PSESF|nr:hypothetical protein [Pseudomonas syringae]EPN56776.1 hypothetical protein A235_33942 [Pseudomonas syringae pv. actinidiae ICMP 19079]EPN85929.1 hypothetical protein A234_04432 [Pseudomonas syringae pv. actinidiae ICMP 19101]AKT28216.1 hypothetical protein IYO_001580 [Pseudomonas syringae pv. actinidiae ICMP 18884]AOE54774.1 hypothetical protein NZ708_01575 [Pseudomonas syringae pv. actinidiae ICMP 18708]APP95637.1 hypothetical protein PsaNZ45_01575 [Pseudomonas syringae pv. actinidiae]